MDRRSRTPDSPGRRHRRRDNSSRRRSRSWSRSRSRERSRERRRRHSRSRSRDRNYRRGPVVPGGSPDLYKEMIDQDYQNDRERYHRRDHDRDRRGKDRHYGRGHSTESYLEEINSNDSFDSDQVNSEHFRNQQPSNKIIILGLAQHITETDINNDLIHYALQPVSIRLIRKKKTGASRGFAFVEFNTEEEATRWMEYKQGVLMVQDQYRAVMQYSVAKEPMGKEKILTDWYCAKCGVFNFKRRENCFKCYASREESEKGGEGSDEISNILTKKIMLRNLDVLTNEEGVLTAMQEAVPMLVSKISKILICRDPLTSTSRGICYLSFDNLVDSMNTHNALKAIEPPLAIEGRELLVSYCVDGENKQINKAAMMGGTGPGGNRDNHHHNHHHNNHHNRDNNHHHHHKNSHHLEAAGSASGTIGAGGTAAGGGYGAANTHQYTLADVPRLAEYSASVYASTAAEHDHYFKYYTDYYVGQISKGQYSSLPTMSQIGETANSGAAVAMSAIQRKQKQYKPGGSSTQSAVQVPSGTDNKKYPTPDVSLYQYDETSGYFYDPQTGLYYDPHSQYYYNNETSGYLYWDQENSTYAPAPSGDDASADTNASSEKSSSATTSTARVAGTPAAMNTTTPASANATADSASDSMRATDDRPSKRNPHHDKVKVAKKIVKDMEKWAKQLNQKKDMNQMQAPVPMQRDEEPPPPKPMSRSGGYADVGFSILENKERVKVALDIQPATTQMPPQMSKIVSSYGSDSDTEPMEHHVADGPPVSEKDYVEFDKLTCLLCKRAFQSLDILTKHLKMSNLHKENLIKYNMTRSGSGDLGGGGGGDDDDDGSADASSLSYRDRAKERRQKYGESDPPPVNKSRERFEKELQKQKVAMQAQTSSKLASVPIGENNVGNRLLQKMGWTEGQGLGRKNQGRTNIIEAESRAPAAGLGTKSTNFAPGDDYKTYIKRMMKTRYDQVDY